jgi:hypothetical protein
VRRGEIGIERDGAIVMLERAGQLLSDIGLPSLDSVHEIFLTDQISPQRVVPG